MLSDTERQKILDSVLSKIGSYRCPICGFHKFTIVDGYVATCLQNNIKNINIGNSFLPSVMVEGSKAANIEREMYTSLFLSPAFIMRPRTQRHKLP